VVDIAKYATAPQTVEEGEPTDVKFSGSRNNMAVGVGLLVAGGISFMMGMTDVFFAGALAWVFLIWGLLFIYVGMIDEAETFIVTDDALLIKNSMRPFSRKKVWNWADVNRMDIVIKRVDARDEDDELRIYYMDPGGEITLEREEREYSPALARLVIERAGLSPASDDNPTDLEHLPAGKADYIWQ